MHLKIHCRHWISSLQFITILGWGFLTAGIFFGSWWAYRELGWGGFWFWDPVENAALLPWLFATALFHSALVSKKITQLKNWTILLTILTFLFTLVAFFLVRSGVVISVHSFAYDPGRGMFILFFILLLFFYSVSLFIYRKEFYESKNKAANFISKVNFILLNILLLITIVAVVCIGTLYPLFIELFTGYRLTVGAPFFNLSLMPILALMLIFITAIPLLKWQVNKWQLIKYKLSLPFILAAIITLTIWYKYDGNLLLYFILLLSLFAGFVLLAAISKKENMSMLLAHAGFIVLIVAISLYALFKQEKELVINNGERTQIAQYKLELKEIRPARKQNYFVRIAEFAIYKNGKYLTNLYPEKRLYIIEQDQTSEAAIIRQQFLTSDLYMVVGDLREQGIYTRIYYNPLVNLIWLSGLLMVLGALVNLKNIFITDNTYCNFPLT